MSSAIVKLAPPQLHNFARVALYRHADRTPASACRGYNAIPGIITRRLYRPIIPTALQKGTIRPALHQLFLEHVIGVPFKRYVGIMRLHPHV